MTGGIDSASWFPLRRPDPDAHVRLICLPFAGGTAAAFQPWHAQLPGVELCGVELPGRARRFSEPLLPSIAAMIAALQPVLASLPPLPTLFFGHSMGAHLAHRLAHAQEQAGEPGPAWIVVSASRPPQAPEPEHRWRSRLSDPDLLEFLRLLNGIPDVFLETPELIELMLPTIRADFRALESLPYDHPLPVAAGIATFAGRSDRIATPDRMDDWAAQTRGRFLTRCFDGGHFFIEDDRDALLAVLRDLIATV